jgi:hypothetical protein
LLRGSRASSVKVFVGHVVGVTVVGPDSLVYMTLLS